LILHAFSHIFAPNSFPEFFGRRPPLVKKERYLIQRESGFYARLAVPQKLQATLGKKELWAPVKANTKAEAIRRLAAVVAPLQAEIEAARLAVDGDPANARPPRVGRPLSVRQAALAYYAAELGRDAAERDAGEQPALDPAMWRPAHEAILRKIASGRFSDDEASATIGWAIEEFRAKGHTDAAIGTPAWRELAKTLAGVHLETFKRIDEREGGDFTGKPSHPLLNKLEPAPGDPLIARMLSPDSAKTLSEILPTYLAERSATARTDYDSSVTVRMFEEFLGEPRAIYQISRADIRGFKNALAETPSNYKSRFDGSILPDAIKKNKELKTPYPPLKTKTINDKYLSKLHSLLNWCLTNDLIPDNPASKIKVDSVKSIEAPRVHFAPSDLAKIFDPHRFTPQNELNEPEWAMLISLYAGTRASELAQIKLDSVRHNRDVLVFTIEEETKTIGSKRIVPVHSKLIEYGLDRRINELRAKHETHLFPEWYRKGQTSRQTAVDSGEPLMQNKHFSRFIPKRFNDSYLPKVGIIDRRKSFHSFRHTFLTGLAEAGVDEETRKALGGHTDNSASAGYVHGFSVERLKDGIEKLRFDGFVI
jgi:integrase